MGHCLLLRHGEFVSKAQAELGFFPQVQRCKSFPPFFYLNFMGTGLMLGVRVARTGQKQV